MIYNNIEFHNVDHLEQVEGMTGLQLHRFPEQFSRQLGMKENHNGRFRAERPHGCELRFVTEAGYYDIALTAVESDIDILIYYGDIFHSKHTLKAGVCTLLHIIKPEIYGIVEEEQLPKGQFSPKVWRVLFGLNGFAYFNYLNTYGYEHYPPKAEEKPEITWAAYGSSITCGSATTLYSNSYINQAAIRLGYDVLNKGLSGSCLCEDFVADYFAELDVDVLTLEVGVNMVMLFDETEFRRRIEYLLNRIKESPAKRIYMIDMFPNKGLIANDHESKYYVRYRTFKEITRELITNAMDERIISISGEDIVKDLTYLSTDLLHPSDNGHIRMGENLANWIQQYEYKKGGKHNETF
jgi:hypothetical protein